MLNRNAYRRRGSATLWMVIWLPCLLVLFCVLARVANLWLARVELENALEASALAAVKHWGDAGGGDTYLPRQVGVAYADANRIRSRPVTIGTNYSLGGGPNQNAQCAFTHAGVIPPTGNLIFGAIDHTNPDNVVFNTGMPPSCGAGLVVFDVTSNGELNDNQNEWGIAFHPTPGMPAGLRINYVIITLHPIAGVADLKFQADFEISPNDPGQFRVHDNSGYQQPDVFGFSDVETIIDSFTQVVPSYSPDQRQLRIDFLEDQVGGDLGFQPCDRIRFGNGVQFNIDNSVPNHGNLGDADGIGEFHTEITVGFSNGSVATGLFSNTTHTKNDCFNPGQLSAVGCPADTNGTPKKFVHATKIDDLPYPQANTPDNNGQALGFISGPGGAGKFGIRAQASLNVQPFLGNVFLGNLTEYCVQATTVAEYDCATHQVRLVHIDTFVCPGPDNVAKKCQCSP
jgi:Putative Flp pilus-assembly TadE/G-like